MKSAFWDFRPCSLRRKTRFGIVVIGSNTSSPNRIVWGKLRDLELSSSDQILVVQIDTDRPKPQDFFGPNTSQETNKLHITEKGPRYVRVHCFCTLRHIFFSSAQGDHRWGQRRCSSSSSSCCYSYYFLENDLGSKLVSIVRPCRSRVLVKSTSGKKLLLLS